MHEKILEDTNGDIMKLMSFEPNLMESLVIYSVF